jgi:glycine/D-amino acid oxidase-like deaminating enzyme
VAGFTKVSFDLLSGERLGIHWLRMQYDIVIVGGGAIGNSIAHALASEPDFSGSILVVERDPTYRRASSALSASGIRQQFSTPVNIRMSQYGIRFLRDASDVLAVDGDRPHIQLDEAGYLITASPANVASLKLNHALQISLGARIALLLPPELQERLPWLAVDDLGAGCLGLEGEGWFDGYTLLQALKTKAKEQGVKYLTDEVVGLNRRGPSIEKVRLRGGGVIYAGTVVNAAGPYAREVAELAGVTLPVQARKRSVFVVSCPERLPECPLICDASGIWFRPEGDQYICGYSPDEAEDKEEFDLQPDESAFEERVWPKLAARVPAFESLRLVSAWAGHYEYNTFDQNGLVGRHPEIPNFILANGFSGHGLQHAPAIGRGIAELIVFGEYRELDLSALRVERLYEGKPIVEHDVF